MPEAAPPAIRIEALQLRREGWTLVDIAHALDISPQVIARWAKQENLPSRPQRMAIVSKRYREPSGETCECGQAKTPAAKRCSDCRDALRRGRPVYSPPRYSAELEQYWPLPIPFPPVVAQEPRVIMYDRTEPEHA